MTIFQIIVLLSWVTFLIYWVLNWRKVKPTKEKQFDIAKFRGVALVIILLAVLIIRYFHLANPCQITWSGCHFNAYESSNFIIFDYLGDIFGVLGILIAIIARRTLSTNWSSTVELKKGHELITSGIYSYIRHPIYAGMMFIMLGTVLVFPTILEVIILILVYVTFIFRMIKEEELMGKTFSKEYSQYKKKTKMLIPFIF